MALLKYLILLLRKLFVRKLLTRQPTHASAPRPRLPAWRCGGRQAGTRRGQKTSAWPHPTPAKLAVAMQRVQALFVCVSVWPWPRREKNKNQTVRAAQGMTKEERKRLKKIGMCVGKDGCE